MRRRLPDGWSAPDVYEDTIVADGLTLRRAALSSTGPGGEAVTSSAVDVAGSPSNRAYFELLERVSTLQAIARPPEQYALLTLEERPVGKRLPAEVFPESDDPSRWRFARSNGVALHEGWRVASERALWELAERDRVLRSWQGEIVPRALPLGDLPGPLLATSSYEWSAYTFPATGSSLWHDVEVVGVFGFPTGDDLPMVSGYAGRPSTQDAIDAAVCEAMQVLGFLWGEPPSRPSPELQPTPLHHLEHFQWPAHRTELRRWLTGEHAAYHRRDLADPRREPSPDVRFVDITPAWLEPPFRVVKAMCDAAVPLAFGAAPFLAHLPPELRVHPIA